VRTQAAPKATAASAMRSSSVAINARSMLLAAHAASYTHWIIGLPAILASGFPGKRAEA
jgi:hypothetical protein